MTSLRPLMLVLALTVVACGGAAPPTPLTREAAAALRLARADFARHRYEQAADGYARVLSVAERRDDADLLATAGTERALALLRAGDGAAAAREAAALEARLERQGLTLPVMLPLVRAAAALDGGNYAAAKAQLAQLDVAAAEDPLLAARLAYLRGRVAAARGDRAALAAAIAAMAEPAGPTLKADRLELQGRLAQLDGRAVAALTHFEDVLAARRGLDEPLLVGETLELAGDAAVAAGERDRAADFYLRAARNARALDRTELAERRLVLATGVAAGDPALVDAIATLRTALDPAR